MGRRNEATDLRVVSCRPSCDACPRSVATPARPGLRECSSPRRDRGGERTHERSFAKMSNMSAFHAMALGSVYFGTMTVW